MEQGWGFDASYRDPFFAMTKSIVYYTYDNNENQREVIYRYPTQRQNYAVPDQVSVRTIGQTSAESALFDSWKNFRMTLDLKITLTLGQPQLSGFISIGLGLKIEKTNTEYIVTTTSKSMMWSMTLTSMFLSPEPCPSRWRPSPSGPRRAISQASGVSSLLRTRMRCAASLPNFCGPAAMR